MKSTHEQIAARERQIISYDDQLRALDEDIEVLQQKEHRYRNGRRKKEQKRNTILHKRQVASNAILLAHVHADPAEQQRLLAQLDEHLTTLPASSLLNRPPTGIDQPPAVGPEVAAASRHQDAREAPTSASNDMRRSLPKGDHRDAAAAPHDSARAVSPDAATDAPDDKPPSSADVDGDAAPSQSKARPAGPSASAEPGDESTEKQLKFIKDLIATHPDKARKIGIDSESLSTLSKQKASWVIKQLAPPPTSTPKARNHR